MEDVGRFEEGVTGVLVAVGVSDRPVRVGVCAGELPVRMRTVRARSHPQLLFVPTPPSADRVCVTADGREAVRPVAVFTPGGLLADMVD
jgi:hypothetical protein